MKSSSCKMCLVSLKVRLLPRTVMDFFRCMPYDQLRRYHESITMAISVSPFIRVVLSGSHRTTGPSDLN
jgi:hypothetical protein